MDRFMGSSYLIRDYPGRCKPKLFAALALFYFQFRLYIKMIVLTDLSAVAIAEQLSELIHDFPILKLKLSLRVYGL